MLLQPTFVYLHLFTSTNKETSFHNSMSYFVILPYKIKMLDKNYFDSKNNKFVEMNQ